MKRVAHSLRLASCFAVLHFLSTNSSQRWATAEEDGDSGDGYNWYNDGMPWNDYAIQPKKCINFNNEDVIVFSMYQNAQKSCKNKAMGTYYATVSQFVQAYLYQAQGESKLQGYDYDEPEIANYLECQEYVLNDYQYYVRLGCLGGGSQGLRVVVYRDEYCTERNQIQYNLNIDISGIRIPFLTCSSCVADLEVDNVDDQFYTNRAYDSPLCGTAWSYKSTCNRKCQRMGLTTKEGWNTADKFLLFILSFVGVSLLLAIFRKRRMMSKKEALLEEAAMSVAGLKKIHVIGIAVLFIIVIVIFMCLRVKSITWFMLLFMDFVLLGYLANLFVGTKPENPTRTNGGTSIHHMDDDVSDIGSYKRHGGG